MASGRRKGWDQLSPTYRKRLERSGITKTTYNRGADLHKARGKKSSAYENKQRRFWRLAKNADFDIDEVHEVIDTIGFDEANDILTYRAQALSAGDPVEKYLAYGAMRTLYGQYAELVPKQWLYYHGGGKQ